MRTRFKPLQRQLSGQGDFLETDDLPNSEARSDGCSGTLFWGDVDYTTLLKVPAK